MLPAVKRCLMAFAVLLAACDGAPTAPTRHTVTPEPSGQTAILSIKVVGHLSGRPLADVRVELDPHPKPFRTTPSRDRVNAPRAGRIAGSTVQFTDANGKAHWIVSVGDVHTIRVRDSIISGLVIGDAGWLMSFAE